jgi:Fe-S-cluster-containing hydrogenase component 2
MEQTEVTLSIVQSGVIAFDPELCTGCGTCELMCALLHAGVGGPALARVRLDRDPFNGEFRLHSCRQCLAPGCYVACPLPDDALCICAETGARYIDEEECTGCELCIDACPFEPSHVRFDEDMGVAFKCDLCRGRAAGPICVEYCPVGALRHVPSSER